jgi:3-isopropylmalate dehydratase small subunit
MTRWLAFVVTVGVLGAGLAGAQPKTTTDCNKGRVPEKVEGQVVRVDLSAGIVTVREKDGTIHEFQAPKETLQTLKAGDQIEAKLREAPKC